MSAPRLIPRWWSVTVLLFLFLSTVVGILVTLVSQGLLQAVFALSAVAFLLLLVAAARSLAVPRRRRMLETNDTGTTVIESPALIVWPIVMTVLLLYAAACGSAVLLITDFDAIESPGAAFVLAAAAIGGAPEMLRLLTGRLHRWRLTLGPDGYTYQGYRTDETAPWSKVHAASIQMRRPAGVLIDRKGSGKDCVVPIAAFDLPAEQIAEEIQARLVAYRQ